MIRFYQPADLVASPADKTFDTGMIKTAQGRPVFVEVANLSPYIYEIQGDSQGDIRAIVGAMQYVSMPFSPICSQLVFHAIGTQISTNLPAANFAVYVGITRNPPLPPPDPSRDLT